MIARSTPQPQSVFAGRVHPAMVGLWIFIAAEALFFGLLIAAYFYLRIRIGEWPPPNMQRPEILLPAINSIVLLSSGVTMHGAHMAMQRGDAEMLRGGIVGTMVLGIGFLLGQAFEYAHAGFGLDGGVLGSSFFTLTGFHGAHVLVGLIFLGLIWIKAGRGYYTAGHHLGVEGGALYWHFVDAVWVVLFTVLYLA